MKRNIHYIILLALLSATSFAQGKKILVTVDGMVCPFCSQGITKKFTAHPSIQDVKVDMDKKEVSLSVKEGQSITDEEISQLIKDAGVSVNQISR